jgi:hypothetical protein
MEEPEPAERPGELCTCIPVDWPNKIQRRVLRKLYDLVTPGEDFHENRLAKRLHMPVEEGRRCASTWRCWPILGWWRSHDDTSLRVRTRLPRRHDRAGVDARLSDRAGHRVRSGDSLGAIIDYAKHHGISERTIDIP